MIPDRTKTQFDNPFKRINFTDREREEAEAVWNLFYIFWSELAPKIPDCAEKTLVMRNLQQALFYYEAAHTIAVKIKDGK